MPSRVILQVNIALPSLPVLFAVALRKVTDVWGFLGSTANVVVAFTLPCAAYLKIRLDLPRLRQKTTGFLYKRWVAAVLLVLSVVVSIACTANSFYLVSTRKQEAP